MDKKRGFFSAAAVLAAALVFFPACAIKTVKTETLGNPASGERVLIAYDSSDFKKAVADEASSILAASGMAVTVTDAARLGDQDPASYGAVVLMAPVVIRALDGNVRRFMEKCPDKSRVILVTTAGDTDYSADVEGVDAVTEASVLDDAGALARTVAGKVKAIFKKE